MPVIHFALGPGVVIFGSDIREAHMTGSPWRENFERLFPGGITVRPTLIRGTNCFVSYEAARRCYGDCVHEKINAGEIFICKPMLGPGEELVVLPDGQ